MKQKARLKAEALTSHNDPQKINDQPPHYLDKVDILVDFLVSSGAPFRNNLPANQMAYFHSAKVDARPGGYTRIGPKFLSTNGKKLVCGKIGLVDFHRKQRKTKESNQLSDIEINYLKSVCDEGQQPCDVQAGILKDQVSKILSDIQNALSPYCPHGAITFNVNIGLSALETYIQFRKPADSNVLRIALMNVLRLMFGNSEYGFQNVHDKNDRSLEDRFDKWSIKIDGEWAHLKLYPKGDFYRLEIRRVCKSLRFPVANANLLWAKIDRIIAANQRLLFRIAKQLGKAIDSPQINVEQLRSLLKNHFRKVADSKAFDFLVRDWANTGVYDPTDYKDSQRLSSYLRNKLIKLGFCIRRPKTGQDTNGGRYFLVLRYDWQDRVTKS